MISPLTIPEIKLLKDCFYILNEGYHLLNILIMHGPCSYAKCCLFSHLDLRTKMLLQI